MTHPFQKRALVKSAYRADQTMQEVADEWAENLLMLEQHDQIDFETPFAAQEFRSVQYMLAGGGPTCDVTFVFDLEGEVQFATVGYYEAAGTAFASLDYTEAQPLWDAFQRMPVEQQIEVTDD